VLKALGKFLVIVHPLWNIAATVAILTVPIFLILFLKPKWLAILLGAVNLVILAYVDALVECLRPDELCNSEDFEIGPFLVGFIFGIVYSSIILAIISLIRMFIYRRQ
jgi:hypothetical protein